MTGSVCDQIAAQALGLVALRTDDPERQAAAAHAQTCRACAAALTEAAQILARVDAALPPTPPRPDVLARVSRQILAELAAEAHAPTSTIAARSAALPGAMAAVVSTLGVLWLLPLLRHLNQGPAVVTSGLMALTVATAATFALTRGGRWLSLLPLGSLLMMAVTSGGDAGLQATVGRACGALELTFAALPLGLAYVLARRGLLARPASSLATAAGSGAMIGQAVLHVSCHALPSTGHTFVFHVLPVMLSLALGAALGRRKTLRA